MNKAVRLAACLMAGCVGAEAPDVEVCRDLIARVCAEPLCTDATARLHVTADDCQAQLLARTGCEQLEFGFTVPDRSRVLTCRLPLVRESEARGSKPSCDFVDEAFRICPDLVTFLGGTP